MKAYRAQLRGPNGERDLLIADHIEIARRISSRMARRCPAWISRDDLIAAAMLGLTEAAARYDVTRDEPFLAFAEKRIRGAVVDELRRGDIMPRRLRQLARKIGATITRLEGALGGPPTDQMVADELGVSLEEYKEELEELVHVTIGALEGTDDGDRLASGDHSPEHLAVRSQGMRRVCALLPTLEARDQLVLAMYYNEELTYPEIAEVLGVTTSRVCQIHGRAIAKLRADMDQTQEAA